MSRNAGNEENGEFDDILPKTKIQANKLKARVPTKRRFGEFGERGKFDDISPNTKIQANELKTKVPTKR